LRRKRKRPSKRREFPRKWPLALVAFVCVAAGLGGLAYGGHALKGWVASSDSFRVNKILMTDAPEWLPPSVVQQLESSSALEEGTSIFAPDLLRGIRAGFLQSGWVKEVRWVRKSFPDTITCGLKLRRPCGAVLSKVYYYLTDSDGVRLPGAYKDWPSDGFSVPMITGAGGRVPPVGQAWEDDSVGAAVSVLKKLAASEGWDELGIKSIDVSNLGGRVNRGESDIVLRTEVGTEIWWGRAPGTKSVGERSVESKVAELSEIARKDSLKKYRYIDLRFEPAVKMLR